MKKLFAAGTMFLGFFLSQTSCAEIILSIESGATFAEGTGVREVRIMARSTDPTADRLLALAADIKVTGAVFSFVSPTDFIADNYDPDPMSPTYQQWFSSGPKYTKLFNEADYIGFGNLNKEGGSSLQFNTMIDGGIPVPDPTTGALSLEFNAPEQFPLSDTPLGKLRVDITGLAAGQYPIDFTYAFADGTFMAEIPSSTVGNFFTITAIPEPGSVVLVVGTMLVGSWRRRRDRQFA